MRDAQIYFDAPSTLIQLNLFLLFIPLRLDLVYLSITTHRFYSIEIPFFESVKEKKRQPFFRFLCGVGVKVGKFNVCKIRDRLVDNQ